MGVLFPLYGKNKQCLKPPTSKNIVLHRIVVISIVLHMYNHQPHIFDLQCVKYLCYIYCITHI